MCDKYNTIQYSFIEKQLTKRNWQREEQCKDMDRSSLVNVIVETADEEVTVCEMTGEVR